MNDEKLMKIFKKALYGKNKIHKCKAVRLKDSLKIGTECGTKGKFSTVDWGDVTCKRCLKKACPVCYHGKATFHQNCILR